MTRCTAVRCGHKSVLGCRYVIKERSDSASKLSDAVESFIKDKIRGAGKSEE
jgi:hypothetical protein